MLNNKSNALSYIMKKSSKNPQKISFGASFNPVTRVCDFSNGAQDTLSWQFFLSRLSLFDSNFSGIVGTDKVHGLMKEFAYLTMVTTKIEKNICYHSNTC